MTVQSITIDGVPATFVHQAADLPRRPERPGRSRPARARRVEHQPGLGDQPEPAGLRAGRQQRGRSRASSAVTTKLVITPAAADPGRDELQGRRQLRRPARASASNPSLGTEGWFKNNTPAGDGAMVTTRAVGHDGLDAAQQPRVGQADLRRPLDGQLRPGARRRRPTACSSAPAAWSRRSSTRRTRTTRRPARARSTGTRPSRSAPTWSRTASATSTSPSAWPRPATSSTTSTRRSDIAAARKATNKAIMDMQEDITHFQERSTGRSRSTPTASSSRCRAPPSRRRCRRRSSSSAARIGNNAEIFSHENMHQWWGDTVSYVEPRYTFFKEGYADISEYLYAGRHAGKAAGPVGSAAYNAAFEAVDRDPLRRDQQVQHDQHDVLERRADEPDVGPAVRQLEHLHPPGHVLHRAARDPRQRPTSSRPTRRSRPTTAYGSITPPQQDRDLPEVHAEPVERLPQQARRVLQAVVGHGLHGLPGGRATSRRSRARAWPATTASMTPTAAARTTASTSRLRAGRHRAGDAEPDARRAGRASAAFTPGRGEGLHGDRRRANVISTAGDATLSVADPSTTAPGHLVNGAFSLPTALKAVGTSPAGTVGRRAARSAARR